MARESPAVRAGNGGLERAPTRIVAVTARHEWGGTCASACRLLPHAVVEVADFPGDCTLPAAAASAGLILLDESPHADCSEALDALERRAAGPLVVILVAASVSLERLERAIRLGVRGVVPPDARAHELSRAIDAVLHGELWLSRRMVSLLVGRLLAGHVGQHVSDFLSNSSLTEREREVARMTVEGRSNREIADALDIGVQTVKIHLYHVYQKLRLNRRGQLITRATGSYREWE